jgi:hypothetical protein
MIQNNYTAYPGGITDVGRSVFLETSYSLNEGQPFAFAEAVAVKILPLL